MELIRKSVFAGLVLLIMASLLSNVFIHLSDDFRMPSSPQPETGRIYSITVNHGDVVYVTAHELQRAGFILDKIFYVGWFSVAALLLLKTYWKKR